MRVKYTKELLQETVKDCTSVAQVIRKLGLKEAGGTHSHISRKLKEYGVDTSHFLGQRANQGKDHKGGCEKKSFKEILIKKDSTKRPKTLMLRRALIESGREYKCELCGLGDQWTGKEIRLEVDHKNNDWTDNRSKNLRFCCPNCHSQQKHRMNCGYSDLTDSIRYDRMRRNRKSAQ